MLDEALALLHLKFLAQPLYPREKGSPELERCYELLKMTSRSFAAVIEQLHPRLRDGMMIFYVVLRGLDTIEDDPGLDNKIKIPLLRSFRSVLKHTDWTFHDSSPTESDRVVLEEFNVVLKIFHELRPEYQEIISDITNKMGNGMADYVESAQAANYEGVPTITAYDLYCHHVAGIVGEGITRMALVAEFASPVLADPPFLYEDMGLFLQKTNIIRDYREDIDDGRSFWPKEIWGKYSSTDLREFTVSENVESGLTCTSELVLNALHHVPEVLQYLSNVRESSLFRFCAIPQVMAIATLELVFRNPVIFHSHIKISKGLAARLILECTSIVHVYAVFREFTRKIHKRNVVSDPNFLQIELACARIEQVINANDPDFARLHPSPAQRRAESEDFWQGILIILAGMGFGTALFGTMIGVAYFLGAEFPNFIQIFKDQYHFFTR